MSVAYPNPLPPAPFSGLPIARAVLQFPPTPPPPLTPSSGNKNCISPFFNRQVEINSVDHMGDKYGMILKIFIVKLLQKKNITGIKEVRIIC